MRRKVKFTVEPSEAHHEILTVQDAFQQAIDFFDLLTDDADTHVVWKLEMASTNSPFTCEGEPVDIRTWAAAYNHVEERVNIVERNFQRIAEGKDFDDEFPREKLETARRLLRRNMNGVGLTRASFSEDAEAVVVSQQTSKRYFEDVLRPAESLHSYLFSSTARHEIGSLEGRIVEIGTDYDAPALQIKEHNTGRAIWCRVSVEKAQDIGSEMKANDAWNHRRVRVSGTLNYDNDGNILRVLNGTFTYIDVAPTDLDKLEDREFTEGYSPSHYLDLLRENEFD